ncbi:hypothetical protein [Actinoalloteichus hymeniacidonis]|uniref:Uncharacterized protein n=1 Tax=Actinoalloteichus hymeniacidonis TaxID=340345 RepID=A0AAC9HUQ3_9PSEU|nr:hypothetical protein [Actinoalloteichus hymeniacidonis]AOS65959.1 hypothetical protein TL08_25950 [Actinoalloteichus hymeniacidonis]MBB5905944.1 hypothetical protein [Actinoalloteichus hymeniacidonis]
MVRLGGAVLIGSAVFPLLAMLLTGWAAGPPIGLVLATLILGSAARRWSVDRVHRGICCLVLGAPLGAIAMSLVSTQAPARPSATLPLGDLGPWLGMAGLLFALLIACSALGGLHAAALRDYRAAIRLWLVLSYCLLLPAGIGWFLAALSGDPDIPWPLLGCFLGITSVVVLMSCGPDVLRRRTTIATIGYPMLVGLLCWLVLTTAVEAVNGGPAQVVARFELMLIAGYGGLGVAAGAVVLLAARPNPARAVR